LVLVRLDFFKGFGNGHFADVARFVNHFFGNGQVKRLANEIDAPDGDGGRRVLEENLHLFDAARHLFAKHNHFVGHVQLHAALNDIVVNVGHFNGVLKVGVVNHLDKSLAPFGDVRLRHVQAVGNHLGRDAKAVVLARKQNARPHQGVAVFAARVELFVQDLVERLGVHDDRARQVEFHTDVLNDHEEQAQRALLVRNRVPRVQLAHVALGAVNDRG